MNEPLVHLTEAQARYYNDLKRLRGKRGLLLELLLDGKWHDIHECASAGGLSFNDSIFAFRQEGWLIESRHVRGGDWQFRLVGEAAPRDGHKPMTRPQRVVALAYLTAIEETLGPEAKDAVLEATPRLDAIHSGEITGRGGTTVNLCASCNQNFGSLTAFDRHRIGRYAHAHSEQHPDGRRCLNEDEMHTAGLHQDANGSWRLQTRGTPPWRCDVDARKPAKSRDRPVGHLRASLAF
jgi:hypothetical protein